MTLCPRCGQDNRAGVRFCEECGARIDPRCPACESVVPAESKFCGTCGTAVSAPEAYAPALPSGHLLTSRAAVEGERKHVTVLFADIRSSLEMLADRDPEESRAVLDPVLLCMMDAVHRYEGTVNQVLGDGIMALFGAPLAYEDHAVRACHAALDMHDAVALVASKLLETLKVEVSIRVGLNSGEVVVRSIGSDLRMDYTAVGQTTHLAGRMEQLARPGSTLMTRATSRLVEGHMDVRPLGLLPVKGLAEPMDLYELAGRREAHGLLRPPHAQLLTRFVGREIEIAELRRAAGRAISGHGQVVAIVGEPGVGKSRLVHEFTRASLGPGWRLLEAAAVSYARSTPYLPVIRLLRRCFGLEGSLRPDQIQQAVMRQLAVVDSSGELPAAPLSALLGGEPRDEKWEALDPAPRRQQTLDAISHFLLLLSRMEPLCLVLEDLHWIDAETHSLLDRLIDRVVGARVVVIVSYRPEFDHRWAHRSYYAQLPLDPLPQAMAEELLDELLGPGPDLRSLKASLIDRTEGNPFFLEECVRHLVETGGLTGERGAYKPSRARLSLPLPDTVQALLAARMDRLTTGDKRVLQCAAVVGKEVSIRLLEPVTNLSGQDIRQSLERLQAAEFVYELSVFPAPVYTFKHTLTTEVAYGSLLVEQRRALDARVLDALERLDPDDSAVHVERLAHHAFRGEVWEKAVRYCREAGARAFSRSAHRAALDYFEQALGALEHLPTTVVSIGQAIDLRLDMRYALMPLGDFQRLFDCLTRAQELARTAGDQRRLGLVSAFLTNYFLLMGEPERAVEHGRRALELARAGQDVDVMTVANTYLGGAYYVLGQYAAAIETARENVSRLTGARLTERFGVAALPSVYSRTWLAWSLAELGEFPEAERIADEGLSIAESTAHSFSLIYAYLGVGTVALRRGRAEHAVEALSRAFRLCQEADVPLLFATVAIPLTSAYVLAGRGAEALRVIDEAGARAASINDPVGRRASGAVAEAYLATGRAADALPLARRYLEQRRELKARGFEAWALRLLGDVVRHQSPPQPDEAAKCYEAAQAIADNLGMKPLSALCNLRLGSLYRELGRGDASRTSLAAAEELIVSLDMTFWLRELEEEIRISL